MLESIHVRGFKSLREATVKLAPLVILFGPNAAGKSNLLEAILLLSRLVSERTLNEAFSPTGIRGNPLEAFSLPAGGIEALLHTRKPTLRLDAEMRLETEGKKRRPDLLSYQVEVGIQPQTGQLSVEDECLKLLSANRKTLSCSLEKMTRTKKEGVTEEVIAIRRKRPASPPL
ncbi:MAG: AAA family ATPase [Cyanobacteriota bacterium]